MLKIALGQMEVIPGRPDINTTVMLDMITAACDQHADMIIFPEMAIPGYLLGDTWEQLAFLRDCEDYGRQIIAASENICVIFGNVAVDWNKQGEDGRIRKYNACFVAQNGNLLGGSHFPYPFRIKTLHPNYREFDDTRHFFSLRKLALELSCKPEELLMSVPVEIKGRSLNIGCILCEDGWIDDYSLQPAAVLHRNGPLDLLINISSSPFTLGKNNKRNRVFSKQARECGVPLIYVNNVGMQNNGKTVYTFDGVSTVYDQAGDIITYVPPFSAVLHYVTLAPGSQANPGHGCAVPNDQGIDSIYQALYYGIRQFLQSINMKKVVIGASGGIDSAVCAALYVHILGPDNVLLINMPSVYNSATTKDLAYQLARNLGCLYATIPIQPSFELTVNQLQTTTFSHLGGGGDRQLSVSPFAQENIQARDRSARILAGAAAAFGCGFTCNANKSELTVGYSTLYGDQAGFLAALADLWKHQVYELAQYLNTEIFQREVIPQQTIDLVPSAELSAEQAVDEGKGDPIIYPYHDYLFRSFVEHWNKATPEDILQWYTDNVLEEKIGCQPGLVARLFSSPRAFIDDLERWWKLFSGMGIAKRIQAPPVLAVSRRAYGFDYREAQNRVYYTKRYRDLREQLLGPAAEVQ